jgi:outer membrane protein OmpA-like peptidoglycan-associated protein
MTDITNRFASKIVRAAGTAILASMLTTVSVAQSAQSISIPARAVAATRVLFFDVHSASLSTDAKTIVLSAVDAAERSGAKLIEIAAYAADDESARDMNLSARRAEVVKQQIVNYGFQGQVIVDDEAPYAPLAATVANDTVQRLAILRASN